MKLFLTSSASDVMEKIISMLPKPPKDLKVVFIPTAADPYDDKNWMEEDRNKLVELGFQVADFDLKGKSDSETRLALSSADIIFVAGGNTFYLLEWARKSGFDKIVKELVNRGKIYIGSSAGSILAGPNIEIARDFDDPSEAELSDSIGIGLVDIVVLPHYGKEGYGESHRKVMQEFSKQYNIVPITDKQLIIVGNNSKYQIV